MDLTYLQSLIFAVLLASARIGSALAILPPTQDSMITGVARKVLVMALAFFMMPKVWMAGACNMGVWVFLVIAVKEVLIGFLIGYFASIPFYLAENLGSLIDNQRGSTMSEVYSPLSGTQVSTIGIFFSQILNALFFVSGAWLIFLGGLYKSYEIWPIYSSIAGFDTATPVAVLGSLDQLMKQTLVLSSPVLIAMLLATVGLGLVNRAAPQLNVFFLSMPIKSALGIWMLVLYLQYLVELLLYKDDNFFLGPVMRIIR